MTEKKMQLEKIEIPNKNESFQQNNLYNYNMNIYNNNNYYMNNNQNNFINNNDMLMNNNYQNMQFNINNIDNINKELFDAFQNDINKYNYMIQNMNPALLELCSKRMAEMNNSSQLINQNFNYNNINGYMNMFPNNINAPNFYNNYNYINNNNNNYNNNNLNQINKNINNTSNINTNNNNSIDETQKLIPEYETIDTESDPVNKYIENAINYSSNIKHLIVFDKQKNPEYFINIEETLSSPGLLSKKEPSNNDYKYILCLLGKILENQGIEVGIYKDKHNSDRIDLSAIQFIFSGLINRKKYRLKFSKKYNINHFVTIKGDSKFKKDFIDEWKTKITKKLDVEKKLIILTNPRNNNTYLFIDLAFNPKLGEINEEALKKLIIDKDIIECQTFPLLGGCRLSSSIFKTKFNKYYGDLNQVEKKRGGEIYIPPSDWTAYGINVSQKFDFGNDNWLGNSNKKGEFAVAYYGINNVLNNSLKRENSLMGNHQTGKTFIKVKNIRKQGHNCKSGAYFYNNPNFAENSSEIINIGGYEYKIMFMCRVNPSKIMQPENFKDCWILSPTPDEVRPYKILIKKPISALAIASEEEIKICIEPPQLLYDIIKEKDESYFNKFNNDNNNTTKNKYDSILREWTGIGSQRINDYLRKNTQSVPVKDIKSNIWCLHKAITESESNVNNNTTVYRGIKVKLPKNIGKGTQFYFKEFLSTSKDIETAKVFANCGTLMHISIQNNGINGKKVYCRDIENISQFPHEKEIIFTAFCHFIVTDIKKEGTLDVIYLTCDGYNF